MSELQSLSQIFQNKIFRVPDYQRGYAWQDSQLRDFLEDVINLHLGKNHYTGLLSLKMLSSSDSQKLGNNDSWLLQNGYKACHVVDGQQRLTTFIILLNEIIVLVRNLPENKGKDDDKIYLGFDSIKDICAKYIKRQRPYLEIFAYIFGYESDNPSANYLKYVLGEQFGVNIEETYYTKNLKYAKEFFARELNTYYGKKGIDGIEELYRKLTLQLMFNIHMIEDDYDVYVAFETMNNRGKKLTSLELLKNRLIYLTTLYPNEILDKTGEQAIRTKINEAWKIIYRQLGRNEKELLSDEEFLRDHWIIYFYYSGKKGDNYIKFLLRKFSHKSIFKNVVQAPPVETVEDACLDYEADDDDSDNAPEILEPNESEYLQPKEILDYVNSLQEASEYWYYTKFPEQNASISEEEQVWIDKLNYIGLGYFKPLIAVSLIQRLGYTKEERIELFKAIERFIFINFRMAMYRSSYKRNTYYRKTYEIYTKSLTLSEVAADLNTTTDNNAKYAVRLFVARMGDKFISADGFYSWNELKYFLCEYEYSLATKYPLKKLEWALLPKVVKDSITIEHILPQHRAELYWRNNFRQFSDEEKRLLSSSLGNLLPLSHSMNSSLQDKSFDDKKERGYVNGCYCEIEVSKEETWDAAHIYNRGIKLLRFMESRWDFKFDSQEQMDDLLHIGFVNDGREIPEEITDNH